MRRLAITLVCLAGLLNHAVLFIALLIDTACETAYRRLKNSE